MAQSLSQKAVNNFVKGLITEAAELTFPEGASVDELNCDLRRDGTRRRRLGAVYENSHTLSSFTLSDSEITATGDWINVGGNADLEFLVLQKGNTLFFYNKGILPYSAQVESNSVNLASFQQSGSAGAENAKCQFTSIKGNLVVSSPEINTIAIVYDSSSGAFTVTQVSFEVRDFEFQGDTSTYFDNESSPSQDRKYDAQNAGWNTGNGAPSDLTKRLTHPWYAGKNSSGSYNSGEWEKIYGGTTLTANGHYILDFFTKNRGTTSGLTGLTKMTDAETSRFRSCVSFSGRVFYAGVDSAENAGTILFSKIVDTVSDLGICHQQNDPTAEYVSDLLDSDGGVIRIPDAVKIQKLYAYQNSLFVFAENGVWQISGVDGVFRASSFSVNRITRVGILQPETFVEAEGVPFWWSRFGIHTLTTDDVSGQGKEQNLTIPTIQSFWDAIDPDAKLKVTAIYDGINKRIYWGYPDASETVESKLNNFLILDVPLQAFFPWKISDQTSNTDSVVGLAFFSGYGARPLELDVLANSSADDVLTASGGSDVNAGSFTIGNTFIIKTVGTTDFTTIGSADNNVGTVFTATGATITAGSFIVGRSYKIKNAGTTDFTTIGAADSNVGTVFTASGVGSGSGTADEEIVAGSGTGVATTTNDVTSTQISTATTGDPAIILICRDGATNKITMGAFTNIGFLDWGDTNYSSFAETGFDFIGDAVTKKNAPYIVTYCRLTETGFTGNPTAGFESIRPSSLKVSAAWDFAENFGTSQQVYRLKFPVIPNQDDLTDFDYPDDVITSRIKILGHGRSMRIKYESEQGKDFLLLGWGLIQGRNPRY